MSLIAVAWQPPSLLGLDKVNTDGFALGLPPRLGGGEIFRNSRGMVRGCFATPFTFGLSFDAGL